MGSETATRKCSRCGKLIDKRAIVCVFCGHDALMDWYVPIAGGCLAVLAGVVSLAYWETPFFVGTSVLAIIGGALAASRMSFLLGIVGGVGAALGPGFLAGVPALILILLARKSFRHF